METEKNLQNVNFKKGNQWYESNIDLKQVYSSVHSSAKGYGSSANLLVNEMFANLLELAFQKKIELTSPFIITDYGCGQSKASNVLAEVIAANVEKIAVFLEKGKSINEILKEMSPEIKKAGEKEISFLPAQSVYGQILVQRYDIGIPEYSARPKQKADVVFCNDVFEHIPQAEIPAFINGLEDTGKYIFASISLRDAVNYMKIPKDMLWEKAKKVDTPCGIILTEDTSGDYIFSLHVSVLSQEQWQNILGKNWRLLPAQDYTAVSAMNFQPSAEYQSSKKELISQIGFTDFIPFPTKLGSRYEQDKILWKRTALMQPQKHIQKLNALEGYPESTFKDKEKKESLDFLAFIGATVKKENGTWKIEQMPDFLDRLDKLEILSKKKASSDAEAQRTAKRIIELGF